MKLELFRNPPGQIIQSLEGYKAYLPAPLPPTLNLAEVIEPLAKAVQALGELKGAARRTENPYILIEPLQRGEALTTSAMEGTHTSLEQLVLEEEQLFPSQDENARETFNYIVALRHAITELETIPISRRLIKGAHGRLLSGLSHERGANKRPGEYKQAQNWIGGTKDISTARYVPPPPDQTQKCMDDLERYINRPGDKLSQKVIDLALVHYQFEAIHPFADGNGRMGRMLITLLSMQSGLLELPLLYLSPWLEKNKDEYINRMFNVSANSEWIEWIDFFLKCIIDSANETIAKIDRLLLLQKEYRQRASREGRSAKLLETVDMLFHSPVLSVPRLMERYSITYRAADQILQKLVKAGVLTERTHSHPKYFIAHEILAATNRG
jgi:Fic family protein